MWYDEGGSVWCAKCRDLYVCSAYTAGRLSVVHVGVMLQCLCGVMCGSV